MIKRGAVLSMAAIMGCGAGCHVGRSVALGPEVCAQAVCVTPRDWDLGDGAVFAMVDVVGPPSLRLRNAGLRAADARGVPCGTGSPVARLSVDGFAVERGPAAIGGAHHLRLRFPHDPGLRAWPQPAFILDLDLEVGGKAHCQDVALAPAAKGT